MDYDKDMFSTRQQKIDWMESSRGRNHGQQILREWIRGDFDLSGFDHSIHIAGTNGKGSVCAWLETLLAIKGKTTASFISPHLITHNERLRVNGKPIDLTQWEQIFDRYADRFRSRNMTMFEMDLWMAIDLFKTILPDYILVETGLGGMYDATTALDYPLGLITHIGFDHQQYLGNTLEEIAAAKAGILQPNMKAVCAEKKPELREVFVRQASKVHASLFFTENNRLDRFDSIWNPLLPAYQKENLLSALTLLEQDGFRFSKEELAEAISRFFWPARFQILEKQPLLVCDGAHNPDGIEALCRSIEESDLHFDRIFFSVLADKQAHEMIARLKRLCANILLVHFDSYRLSDLDVLSKEEHLPVVGFDEMIEAIEHNDQNTCCCGSLYFVGEILSRFPNAIKR